MVFSFHHSTALSVPAQSGSDVCPNSKQTQDRHLPRTPELLPPGVLDLPRPLLWHPQLPSDCWQLLFGRHVPVSLCLLLALPTLRIHPRILLRQGEGTWAPAAVSLPSTAHCPRSSTHASRDDRYRRDAGADNPPERPPDYPSRQPSYPSPSHSSSAMHHHNMSTLAPSEAGVDGAWVDVEPAVLLPRANQIPRSATAYANVNIDIPLDNHSSMSMEFTNNGKVMELVARFHTFL